MIRIYFPADERILLILPGQTLVRYYTRYYYLLKDCIKALKDKLYYLNMFHTVGLCYKVASHGLPKMSHYLKSHIIKEPHVHRTNICEL